MLMEKFKRDHPPIISHSAGVQSMPVLAITLTSRPTEPRIYGQLLMAMGASINERLTPMELEIRPVLLLKSNNVRVLVFDEVHNLKLSDVPPSIRTILSWNFPVMIPDRQMESSDEGIEVF